MIGLTKARIENLIDFNEECIRLMESLGCGDSDLCFTHKIALMALKSSAVGSFHIYDQKVDATTDYVRDGEWPIDEGEILVYAAPPVPEIKFPDLPESELVYETASDTFGEIGCMMITDGQLKKFIAETKRLNGWG